MEGDKEGLFIPFTKLCGCLTKPGSKNADDINPQQLVFSLRPSLMCITCCPITQENFRSSPSLTALSGKRKYRNTAIRDSL